jgi:hypothetical protein
MNRLYLRFLAEAMQDLDAAGLGLLVDPVFDRPLIEELPGDPRWRADPLTHLPGRRAEFDLVESSHRRNLNRLSEDQASHQQKEHRKQTLI